MLKGSFSISSLRAIAVIPPDYGYLIHPTSFDEFDSIAEGIHRLFPQNERGTCRYSGLSPLFSMSTDSDHDFKRKMARLEAAVELHRGFCLLSGYSPPFRLFTEPFWRTKAGRWTPCGGHDSWDDKSYSKVFRTLMELGQFDIEISQNRVTDSTVVAFTNELGLSLVQMGFDVTIGWQCWPSMTSFESIDYAYQRVQESQGLGLSSRIGEVGLRYSPPAPYSYQQSTLFDVQDFWGKRVGLPCIQSKLEKDEQDWTWWLGPAKGTRQPGGLMPLEKYDSVDLVKIRDYSYDN